MIKSGSPQQWSHKRMPRAILLALLVLGSLAAIGIIHYVNIETPVYYWDFANYHDQYKGAVKQIGHGNLWGFLVSLHQSVQESDYNMTPIIALLPIGMIFGGDRHGFIIGIALFYLIPSALVTAAISLESWKSRYTIRLPLWLAFTLSALSTVYWAPTLRGYPDIAGLVPLGFAGYLILKTKYLINSSLRQSLSIGVLLSCTFLLRRHYAYIIVAILITLAFFGIIISCLERQRFSKVVFRLLRNYAMMLGSMALLIAFLQGPLLLRVIRTSYADLYSGYQEDLVAKLMFLYDSVGLLFVFLVIGGAIYAIVAKADKILFCIIVPVLGFAIFQRTQAPHMHHQLAFFLWLTPVALTPLAWIWTRSSTRFRTCLCVGALGIGSVAMFATFRAETDPSLDLPTVVSNLLPRKRVPPLVIRSYSQLQRLTAYLERTTEKNDKIGILASSSELNPSIIAAMSQALGSRLTVLGDVDSRDGFKKELLLADVIVATDPPSTHLGQENQRVITVPTEALLDRVSPLGSGFSQDSPEVFRLADGANIYIFRRMRPVSKVAMDSLELN